MHLHIKKGRQRRPLHPRDQHVSTRLEHRTVHLLLEYRHLDPHDSLLERREGILPLEHVTFLAAKEVRSDGLAQLVDLLGAGERAKAFKVCF